MITSIADFLRYFQAVNRRAVRDIAALPAEADGWRPSGGEGENAWSINTLVAHMAGSRLYFASAYRGEGWIMPALSDGTGRERWVPLLEESAGEFARLLESTPDEWLRRKVAMIDTQGRLSGWRVLMMMVEHDIHHRSQIDTYAGLNGWEVPQIYGRTAEQIGQRQADQRARYRRQ